jgi:hypothetical protein
MSTRCQIGVYPAKDSDLKDYTALLYRHSDGYPGTEDGKEYGVLPDILPFIKEFLKKRGNDAEYLAARLIQYMCNNYDGEMQEFRAKGNPVVFNSDMLGFGICNGFHSDIEFFYAIFPDRLEVYTCGWDEGPEKWNKIQTISLV